jgi:hypothetical protein
MPNNKSQTAPVTVYVTYICTSRRAVWPKLFR